MPALWLENLVAYSLQIAVIATAGVLLLRLLRIRIPKVRLICWQALMGACLLLPAIQPRLPGKKVSSSVQIFTGPATVADPAHQSRRAAFPVAQSVLALVAAGVAIRFAILGLGFWRIRCYRRHSRFVPGAFEDLQRRMGVFADVLVSEEISGPVTFGLLRPIILVREGSLGDESIGCHELLHVRRRDWLFTVLEEFILSVFWFHPAMWWLVAEIQLAREETVDREVVAILNSRDRYLESLLSLAATKAGLDLVPASPFLRKRHLQKRVASLLKEISMSKLRLNSSLLAFAAALALIGWISVMSFPLQAAPQDKIDAPGVTVQPSALTLLHRAAVVYPPDALAKRIQGSVAVELSLSETGTVNDARVLSGPEELRKAALQSVLQWHYSNDAHTPAKTQATIDFRLPEAENITPAPRQVPTTASDEFPTVELVLLRVPEPLKQQLESRLRLREGDRLTPAALTDLTETLKAVDEHLKIGLRPTGNKKSTDVTISLENVPPAAQPTSVPGRIRVGGNVQSVNLVQKVTPVYPPLAKQARIQGTVRFTVTIGKDGRVMDVELVSGHPLLVEAAKDAVAQWQYRPTLLNGNPVEVVTQVDVNFTLLETPNEQ